MKRRTSFSLFSPLYLLLAFSLSLSLLPPPLLPLPQSDISVSRASDERAKKKRAASERWPVTWQRQEREREGEGERGRERGSLVSERRGGFTVSLCFPLLRFSLSLSVWEVVE